MKAFIFVSLLFGSTAFAAGAHVDKLLTLTNDRNPGSNELHFAIDARGIVQALNFSSHNNGKTVSQVFPIAALTSPDGAVLVEQQGIKALSLRGKVDSATGVAHMNLHFVTNGMSGTYSDCKVNGERDATGTWTLVNAYTKQAVKTAKLVTWSMGITTIEGICPK